MTYKVEVMDIILMVTYTVGIYDDKLAALEKINKMCADDFKHGEAGEYYYYINGETIC